MKSLILTIILFLVTGTASNYAEANIAEISREAKVWICVSSNAYRYHNNRNCGGLCRCTHTIKEVTLFYAIDNKYTPCKICYKN